MGTWILPCPASTPDLPSPRSHRLGKNDHHQFAQEVIWNNCKLPLNPESESLPSRQSKITQSQYYEPLSKRYGCVKVQHGCRSGLFMDPNNDCSLCLDALSNFWKSCQLRASLQSWKSSSKARCSVQAGWSSLRTCLTASSQHLNSAAPLLYTIATRPSIISKGLSAMHSESL